MCCFGDSAVFFFRVSRTSELLSGKIPSEWKEEAGIASLIVLFPVCFNYGFPLGVKPVFAVVFNLRLKACKTRCKHSAIASDFCFNLPYKMASIFIKALSIMFSIRFFWLISGSKFSCLFSSNMVFMTKEAKPKQSHALQIAKSTQSNTSVSLSLSADKEVLLVALRGGFMF